MMRKLMILAVISAVSLTACGGGSSSTSEDPDRTADVITVGTITRIGSVVSNGVEFNTGSASVTLDDEPGNPDALRVGQVVAINGSINLRNGTASARTINFLGEVEGPIASINALENSLMVLGRTIVFDELSVFEDAEVDLRAANEFIELSPDQLQSGSYDQRFESGRVDDHGISQYMFKLACAILDERWEEENAAAKAD